MSGNGIAAVVAPSVVAATRAAPAMASAIPCQLGFPPPLELGGAGRGLFGGRGPLLPPNGHLDPGNKFPAPVWSAKLEVPVVLGSVDSSREVFFLRNETPIIIGDAFVVQEPEPLSSGGSTRHQTNQAMHHIRGKWTLTAVFH